MNDSKKFLEILARFPKHIYLTPDVDNFIEGDERLADGRIELAGSNPNLRIGSLIGTYMICRRPIPESIRRQESWWTLYEKIADVRAFGHGFIFKICDDYGNHGIEIDTGEMQGLCKFSSEADAENAIPILGGEQSIIEHLSTGPGALMRWIMEGK